MNARSFVRNTLLFMAVLCGSLSALALTLQMLIHASSSEGRWGIACIALAVALGACISWAGEASR